jgi:hypothetical protein
VGGSPACKPGSVGAPQPRLCCTGRSFLSTCSRPHVPAAYPRLDVLPRRGRDGPSLAAYSALLRLGFAVPPVLPRARWALTPPFHPYPRLRGGGLLSVALSVTRRSRSARPGVTWQPALWSPDFPRHHRLRAGDATVRPTTTHWSICNIPGWGIAVPQRFDSCRDEAPRHHDVSVTGDHYSAATFLLVPPHDGFVVPAHLW